MANVNLTELVEVVELEEKIAPSAAWTVDN